jgi:hypothetical protein
MTSPKKWLYVGLCLDIKEDKEDVSQPPCPLRSRPSPIIARRTCSIIFPKVSCKFFFFFFCLIFPKRAALELKNPWSG